MRRRLPGSLPAFALTCVLALLSACAQTPSPAVRPQNNAVAPPARAAPSGIVLLRGGVGGVFSQGLDAIGAKLRARGIQATVAGYGSKAAIERQIITASKAGATGPVILVGHSYGANAVTAIAADLDKAGIPVDLLVSLAPTAPRPVSPNVRRALNFYFSSGGWGQPLVAGPGFRGSLENLDYAHTAGVGHFNIEKQQAVQDKVIAAVAAAAGR